MSKPERRISREEAIKILKNGHYGVLSTVSPDGQPYGVPVNYCYSEEENCIFFHCFRMGKKLDNLSANSRVSFSVVGYEHVVPERFTTHYESVIAQGCASLVTDDDEKWDKIIQICEKFSPGVLERRDELIRKSFPAFVICKISVDEISGKRNQDY